MNIEITDPQVLVDKWDQEGWPEVLEWFAEDNFGDETLNQLIYDALQDHLVMNGWERQIKARLKELGVDVYI